MTIKELIEHLQTYHENQPVAYALWQAEDVQCAQEEGGFRPLTATETAQVLNNVQRGHDATIGINWEVLAWHIGHVVELPGKAES